MRVIAVDDEEGALALLTGAIKIHLPDADLYPFGSPDSALEFAEHNVPDIAFLDISMPSISGIEMVKKLKALNPNINIIFATAHSEYMADAFSIHASGYLMKPIEPKEIKRELENLRSPVNAAEYPVFINTFGNFEIYVNGDPVKFSRKPAKEVLAYLVDREGAFVSKKELCTVLLNDPECTHKSMDYLSKIIRDLKASLDQVGAANILSADRKECGLRKENLICDAFEYLNGNPKYINKFHGQYMGQYEWAQKSMDKFMY